MSTFKPDESWKQAIGVLPLEMVLAQEHDRIHGDDVVAELRGASLEFTPTHVISPAAFIDRLLHAWEPLSAAGERASNVVDASKLFESATALDAVAMFVIQKIQDVHRAPIQSALTECADARTMASSPNINTRDEAEAIARRLVQADANLVTAIVAHLNFLLTLPLELEEKFDTFLRGGAIDALGAEDANTPSRVRRRLLEAAFEGQLRRIRDVHLEVVYAAARRHDTAALCLSGGGIRSATFALGVIRGLAHYGLLGRFDYLSTVSGGGYAGSWLSAWMKHTSAVEVQTELARADRSKVAPEPAPLRHLRAYSNFLSPRVGLLSADMWTLIATIGRNLLLNWLVLLPLMAAALLIPRFVVAVMRLDSTSVNMMLGLDRDFGATAALGEHWTLLLVFGGLLAGWLLGIVGTWYVHRNRPELGDDRAPSHNKRTGALRGSQRDFVIRCFLPLSMCALLLTTSMNLLFYATNGLQGWEGAAQGLIDLNSVFGLVRKYPSIPWSFAIAGGLLHLVGWFLAGRWRRHLNEAFFIAVSGVVAGIVAMLLLLWLLTTDNPFFTRAFYTTFATPVLLLVLLVGSQLFTALTSRNAGSAEREWVARFNAWLLIAIVGWATVCGLVLYGPRVASSALDRMIVAGIGGVSGIIAMLAVRSANASGGRDSRVLQLVRRGALALAAPAFAVSIVVGLAAVNEGLISASCNIPFTQSVFRCELPESNAGDLEAVRADSLVTTQLLDVMRATQAQVLDLGLLDPFALPAETELVTRKDSIDADSIPAVLLRVLAARREVLQHQLQVMRSADSLITDALTSYSDNVLRVDTLLHDGMARDSAFHSLLIRREDDVALGEDSFEVLENSLSARSAATAEASTAFATAMRSLAALDVDTTPGQRPYIDTLVMAISEYRELAHTLAEITLKFRGAIKAEFAAVDESLRWVKADGRKIDLVILYASAPSAVAGLFALLVLLGWWMGARIDTNEFSLRAMYQMRLVRAYLSASRPARDRHPNPFTGFDPADDIPMGHLWPAQDRTPAGSAGRFPSSPPMHVVNTTLNLVAGSNLAWQQRMAEPMTITPLHAGSAFLGYRPTSRAIASRVQSEDEPRLYGGGSDGVTLGAAVTISGAAASPNAGSHSSPVLTFLMTFFNARLGAWLGNPGLAGHTSFDHAAPKQKIRPILAEMFGQTTDHSPYVYLSDGGHFENLALYEMVLRRCRFIMVVDAGCDPHATFDDLGNAVRKIRVDLGVPIEFPDHLDIRSTSDASDVPGSYWAVGRIKYSAIDRTADKTTTDGVLVYIKPAVYGGEPRDVKQYAASNKDFPHESTSDQFFSESQFESYRALGEHIVRRLVAEGLKSSDLSIRHNRKETLLEHWNDLLKASATPYSYEVTRDSGQVASLSL